MRGRTVAAAALALAILVITSARADAETVTVGLFAPSAPFPTTAARVELASRLGEHLGKAVGATGTGRVYARASDFAAAVRRGDVTVALVDAAYLATTSGYTVLAASVRGGDTARAWQLVARGGAKRIVDLRGKKVLVPALGGQETSFVANVLLGGVERDFFKIEAAPDTASALAALGLGKADAAVVPVDVDLPAGTTQVLALSALPTPVLVAYGGVSTARRTAIAAAAATFTGDRTIGGFRAGDADAVRAIARRFTAPVKRGPLVVPSVRLVVGDLVEGRTFTIERTPATQFVVAPSR